MGVMHTTDNAPFTSAVPRQVLVGTARRGASPAGLQRPSRLINFVIAGIIGLVVTIPSLGAVTHLPPVAAAISSKVYCSGADDVARLTSYTGIERSGKARTTLVCHYGERIDTISRSTVSLTAWGVAIGGGLILSLVFAAFAALFMGRRGARQMVLGAIADGVI